MLFETSKCLDMQFLFHLAPVFSIFFFYYFLRPNINHGIYIFTLKTSKSFGKGGAAAKEMG